MQRSRLAAIRQGRCPRCGEGFIFKYPVTKIFKFSQMNSTCEKCGVSFEPEPGFYFGAMYVSYAFTIATFFVIWAILYFLVAPPEWVYLVTIVCAIVLFIPINFRYSRILFLYWFGGLPK